MKSIRLLCLFTILAVAMGLCIPLFAQTNGAPAAPAPDQFNILKWFVALVAKYPKAALVVSIVGVLRLKLKPIVALIRGVRRGEIPRPTLKDILNWLTSINIAPLKMILLLVAVTQATGCQSPVPSNHIQGTIAGVPFQIDTRKQTTAKNIELVVVDGSAVHTNYATLRIGEISGTNDPQVIDKSYAGQAAVIEKLGTAINQNIESAIKGLSEGAVKGAKTADIRQESENLQKAGFRIGPDAAPYYIGPDGKPRIPGWWKPVTGEILTTSQPVSR